MIVINRAEYEKKLNSCNLMGNLEENIIDVYHRNNWDHFVKHFDEENVDVTPSYVDYFFDAKTMVCFLQDFLKEQDFDECYISTTYNCSFKLKTFDDDVCKDIYDEFKKLINSMGLKVNTNSAIKMSKKEFLDWVDKFSFGGFCGVSEYSVLIPCLKLLIKPHHHMNYLFYTNDKKRIAFKIKSKINQDLSVI